MAFPNDGARRFEVEEDPTVAPVTVVPVTSKESPLAKAGPLTLPATPESKAAAVTKRPGEMANDEKIDDRTASGVRRIMSPSTAERIIENITAGFGSTVKKATAGTPEK